MLFLHCFLSLPRTTLLSGLVSLHGEGELIGEPEDESGLEEGDGDVWFLALDEEEGESRALAVEGEDELEEGESRA